MVSKRAGVKYCAAIPASENIPGVQRFERIAKRGVEPSCRNSPEWWLWRWYAVCGLSDEPTKIHSGNSAYGALGLAYHLGFADVALVGVDGTAESRIEGGRSRNLSHLPLLFASALLQINVVSCGKLTGIPHKNIEEWLRETE
ncbi:hypothetical protein [Enterobacter cancerogenus]